MMVIVGLKDSKYSSVLLNHLRLQQGSVLANRSVSVINPLAGEACKPPFMRSIS
jgi:hypothetical protein